MRSVGVLQTANGAIGLLERGDGAALPILFLHGVGSDKSVWARQLAHFGASRRAIAIDYPGYGESDPLPDPTRGDFARSALALLDALAISRAHICGLSLGGVVAIALHHLAPERCASLVLADSFALHPDGAGIYQRSVDSSRAMTMRQLAEARAPLLLGSTADDALKEEVVAVMARIPPGAFRAGAAAVWLADQRDRAAAVRVPTLVLVGDEDQITPPELSAELHRLISGSRMAVISRAGHLANLEQPAAFNAEVDRFLSEVEGKP